MSTHAQRLIALEEGIDSLHSIINNVLARLDASNEGASIERTPQPGEVWLDAVGDEVAILTVKDDGSIHESYPLTGQYKRDGTLAGFAGVGMYKKYLGELGIIK